jgi:hypothetical protein
MMLAQLGKHLLMGGERDPSDAVVARAEPEAVMPRDAGFKRTFTHAQVNRSDNGLSTPFPKCGVVFRALVGQASRLSHQ